MSLTHLSENSSKSKHYSWRASLSILWEHTPSTRSVNASTVMWQFHLHADTCYKLKASFTHTQLCGLQRAARQHPYMHSPFILNGFFQTVGAAESCALQPPHTMGHCRVKAWPSLPQCVWRKENRSCCSPLCWNCFYNTAQLVPRVCVNEA